MTFGLAQYRSSVSQPHNLKELLAVRSHTNLGGVCQKKATFVAFRPLEWKGKRANCLHVPVVWRCLNDVVRCWLILFFFK